MVLSIHILERFLAHDVHSTDNEFTESDHDELTTLLNEPYHNWDLELDNPETLYNIILMNLEVLKALDDDDELSDFYLEHLGVSHFDPDPIAYKSAIGHLEQALIVQHEDVPNVSMVAFIETLVLLFEYSEAGNVFDEFEELLQDLDYDTNYDQLNENMFHFTVALNKAAPYLIDLVTNPHTINIIIELIHKLLEDITYLLDETATVIEDKEELDCHSFTILSNSLEYLSNHISNIEK